MKIALGTIEITDAQKAAIAKALSKKRITRVEIKDYLVAVAMNSAAAAGTPVPEDEEAIAPEQRSGMLVQMQAGIREVIPILRKAENSKSKQSSAIAETLDALEPLSGCAGIVPIARPGAKKHWWANVNWGSMY